MRRTVKRFMLGWATRDASMLARPRMRSPDLRILENCITSVDLVLRCKVVGVGGRPVALQSSPLIVITHDHLFLPVDASRLRQWSGLSDACVDPAPQPSQNGQLAGQTLLTITAHRSL